MNSQYSTTQRGLANLHVATQNRGSVGLGDASNNTKNGKTTILGNLLLKDIEKWSLDRIGIQNTVKRYEENSEYLIRRR